MWGLRVEMTPSRPFLARAVRTPILQNKEGIGVVWLLGTPHVTVYQTGGGGREGTDDEAHVAKDENYKGRKSIRVS